MNIITAGGLTKMFGPTVVVNNLTLSIPAGKIFGFIGPSGSGKTTTVRLLTGFHTPTSGEVNVLGCQPSSFTEHAKRQIGYMPQFFVLYRDLTVLQNLNFSASLYGLGPFRHRRLKKLLEFVELREHRHKQASRLSGGMQRRLSLAAALVHQPQLIFLDEPTSGIDPLLRRKFWDCFSDLRNDGRTLFVTTQYVSEAAYCDLIGVMSKGRLLAIDSPDGLRRRAFGGDMIDLFPLGSRPPEFISRLQDLPFIKGKPKLLEDGGIRLCVDDGGIAIPELMTWCTGQNVEVKSLQQYVPSFEDVFIELVKGNEYE